MGSHRCWNQNQRPHRILVLVSSPAGECKELEVEEGVSGLVGMTIVEPSLFVSGGGGELNKRC